MPVQVHPLLREKQEQEEAKVDAPSQEGPVAEVEPVIAPPEAEASPEPEPVSAPIPEPEPDYLLKLDSRNLYQELRRLEGERADVRHVLETYAGRSAARKWEPRIRELEAQLSAKEVELVRALAERMEPEELAEKLKTDRDFSAAYHAETEDPEEVAYLQQWKGEFEDAFDDIGKRFGETRERDYRTALLNGYFGDLDANPARSLRLMQTAMVNELQSRTAIASRPTPQAAPVTPAPVAAKEATPEPAPKPKPNKALSEAQPDVSAPSHGGSAGGAVRMSEVRKMSPPERVERFGRDLNPFIASGAIIMDV